MIVMSWCWLPTFTMFLLILLSYSVLKIVIIPVRVVNETISLFFRCRIKMFFVWVKHEFWGIRKRCWDLGCKTKYQLKSICRATLGEEQSPKWVAYLLCVFVLCSSLKLQSCKKHIATNISLRKLCQYLFDQLRWRLPRSFGFHLTS